MADDDIDDALYPKWEKQFVREETETERELKSLIQWLEQQPAGATYPWFDTGQCLLGRYFTAHYGQWLGRRMSAFAAWRDKASPTHTLYTKRFASEASSMVPHAAAHATNAAGTCLISRRADVIQENEHDVGCAFRGVHRLWKIEL